MTPERWRQIEELYHAAQGRGAEEQAALLDASDAELRAEVERMLRMDSAGQILDSPASALLDAPDRAGSQLGPYKIEALIGTGGMGAVYRAVDTRLDRAVAIKIADILHGDRFEREAQAISKLNHPHICSLYDVGPDYLVMELLEGSLLSEEIKRGPLPVEQAVRFGAQIAAALADAHARSILHRDLKPSNIMITRHGVKVLDFGLARIVTDPSDTQTGAAMGTPAYMAPEQAQGTEPTQSADLFALGLVLFEMLTGRLPYPGASLGQMLASGASIEIPKPSQSREGLPASLDSLVGRLLEKDPARRGNSASDVARELSAPQDVSSARRRPYLLPALATSAVLLLALAVWVYQRERTSANMSPIAGPVSYTQLTSFTDSAVAPALSRDGRMLAFFRSALAFGNADQIWVKLLPDGEPIQVTHDPRAGKYGIAFSPDGSRIGYTTFDDKFETYTVSSLGGDAQLFVPNAGGLTWLDENHVLYSEFKTGIHMGVSTGTPDRSEHREIYFPAHERGMAHYSYPSPDGKWLLVVEMIEGWLPCRLVPFSGGSAGRVVGPNGACTSAAWSPDGKWMYFGALVSGRRHLWRQRFPDGQPEQITFGSTEEDGIAVASDGRSLVTSISTEQNAVWLHDARGDRALSTEGYADFRPPKFCRDGKHVYYLLRRNSPDSPAELWRAELETRRNELVLSGVSIQDFDISDDEKDLVFSTQPLGPSSQIYLAALDRRSPPKIISSSGGAQPFFGSNGEIVFKFTDGKTNFLYAMASDGAGRRKVLATPIFDLHGLSPDRRFAILGANLPSPSPPVPGTTVVPLDGSSPAREICATYCVTEGSPAGNYFYLEIAPVSRENPNGETLAIPVARGGSWPELPLTGRPASLLKIPGSKVVDHSRFAPGPDPSVYAFVKPAVHANLFRIPLQ